MSEIRTRPHPRSPLFSERERHAEERPPVDLAGYALTFAVAAVVFVLALDHGSYSEVSRTTLAIGIWWALALTAILGLRRLTQLPVEALVLGGLLLALTAWTYASTQWAASAELAFAEGNRVALYLGIFLLVSLVSWRGSAGAWADGLALGITAVGLLALFSRLFPDVLDTNEFRTVLTSAFARLSYPLGYWNGLAIFTALAVPLLLRAAVASRYAVTRGLALLPIPALVATIYLTSSRGGFATAFFGTFCFLLVTARRWSAIAAAALAGLGSVGTVAVLEARDELLNHPVGPLADSQGHRAALLIAAVCLLVGIVWAAGTVLLGGRLPENVTLERAGAVLVVVVAAVGIAVSHPVSRFDHFKALPPKNPPASANNVTNHLVNKGGNGRWQLWTAGVDEFRTEPLHGRGAGSFAAWWLQSPIFAGYARDAHSLYAETLGELGIIGILLLGGAFLLGAGSGLVRALGTRDPETRAVRAALFAAFLAFALGAAVDWVWELTAVGMIGVVLLGLMTGPATLSLARRRREEPVPPSRRVSVSAAAIVVALAVFIVGAQAIALLRNLKVSDSQAAASRGDLTTALDDATDARGIEPWASSPYVQLALVNEQAGRLRSAREWIAKAIDRDDSDWRLWLVQGRIQAKLGQGRASTRSLCHSRTLYPGSPLLESLSLRC